MTTPLLLDDLMRDEGCRLTAYADPAGGGVWTIGYGHTGPAVSSGLCWTQDQADQALAADVAHTEAQMDRRLPWWRTLDDVRQDVLVEMAFNMGLGGLMGFTHTLAAVQSGDWATASAGMLASHWARQVGARATRLAAMMQTGERPT